MADFVGPVLPPGLQQKSSSPSKTTSSYGPSLPTQEYQTVSDSSAHVIGPTLPPTINNNTEIRTIAEPSNYGPSLPPGFGSTTEDESRHSDEIKSAVGPTLPSGHGGTKEQQEEEDDIIGPLPVMTGEKGDEDKRRRMREIELRSKAMKDRLTGRDNEDSAPQREDWMLTLPAEFKPAAIGARKFRTGVTDCGDRSVWTDTPADRQRKAKEAHESKLKGEKKNTKKITPAPKSAKERQIEEYVDNYNKQNRSESLMTMHRKRRADERSEKAGGTKERKPFNRETDLEVRTNLVTPAKRRALMKDSKHSLQSKFARGSSSFL